MKARLATVAATCALWLLVDAQATRGQQIERLSIGLLPGESAPTVIRQNEPLRRHLQLVLAAPVDLIVGTDYAATGEALRFGRIDVAYLGPITYVLQRRRAELEPFAKPHHPDVGATFQGAIIVAANGPVTSFSDLRGREVGFGDPASTSGTWVPRHQLLGQGLAAGTDYVARYLGSHDAVALAVLNGKVAAGGISVPILERLTREAKIDPAKLRVLTRSASIPEYAWTFRPGLPEKVRERVRQAFLDLRDPEGLKVFRAERFVPAADSDYDIVRTWVADIRTSDAGRGR